MTDADEITEAAYELLTAELGYSRGWFRAYDCVCGESVADVLNRDVWHHAATCAELRAEAVQRV